MKPNLLLQSLLAGTALLAAMLPGNASVLTSFETDEGFIESSRTNTAGWTFSSNNRIRVSNGTTEPALLGSLSLRAEGGSDTVAGNNLAWADKDDHLDIYSFSFISPGAEFPAALANVAWVYIFLYDEITQANRAVQLFARYGSSDEAPYRIQYTTDNGRGIGTTRFAEIGQDDMNFLNWNTISADFNFDLGTYSISLNNNTVVSNILLPTSWDVSAIVGTQLVSPSTGLTTYYDAIIAIPEPSTAQMLGLLSAAFLLIRMQRKIRRAS